jgi:hypothetical protein
MDGAAPTPTAAEPAAAMPVDEPATASPNDLPTSSPSDTGATQRVNSNSNHHDIEVKLLSHSDDQSGVLRFPDTPLSITAGELKQMVMERLNNETNPEGQYLLFMGRRVTETAAIGDVVVRVVSTTPYTCY